MRGKTHPLRKIRMEMGLSIEAFADLCGVGYQTVFRCENHDVLPRIKTRLQIMDALGLKGEHGEYFGRLPGTGGRPRLPKHRRRRAKNDRHAIRRERLLAEGKCEDCAQKRGRDGTATRCHVCKEAHNEHAREYWRQKRERAS